MNHGEPNLSGNMYDLERQFSLEANIQLKVSRPFKKLIQRVASERKISMNDLIRQAITEHLDRTYPGYLSLYMRLLSEEADKENKPT